MSDPDPTVVPFDPDINLEEAQKQDLAPFADDPAAEEDLPPGQ